MTRIPLFIALAMTAFASVRADVRLVGSDLLGKEFVSAIQAYSKRNELGVKPALAGSRAGLEQLRAGQADLALVVFAPDEKKPEEPFVAMPVAYHTAVVVVPAAVPLTQISFAQLKSIFSDDAQSGVKRWNDLGVTGEWTHRNVLPNVTGPGAALTYELFRHAVMGGAAYRPTVIVQQDVATIRERILGDEGGIAIMPQLPEKQPRLKALLVAGAGSDVAFDPSPENIHSGDYPIRLPLYMVFRKDAARRMQTTLRYLLSEDAVPLWKAAGLVALPIQARNQMIFDLEVL